MDWLPGIAVGKALRGVMFRCITRKNEAIFLPVDDRLLLAGAVSQTVAIDCHQ